MTTHFCQFPSCWRQFIYLHTLQVHALVAHPDWLYGVDPDWEDRCQPFDSVRQMTMERTIMATLQDGQDSEQESSSSANQIRDQAPKEESEAIGWPHGELLSGEKGHRPDESD